MQQRCLNQCGLEVLGLGHGALGLKAAILGLLLIIMGAPWSLAQIPSATSQRSAEQEIMDLSKEKWDWMSEKKVEALANLFHEKAVFVHMGGTMTREHELDVIKTGGIHYKKADIYEVSVNIIGTTAILLNRLTLLAVVGGNEVTNPFVVTEVYVKQNGSWKLASMSFTRLLTP
jgi:ketosteroid isomerase-like protein